MASLLANAVLAHHAALLKVAGVVVTYYQDGESAELEAVLGSHFPVSDGLDMEEVVYDQFDWLIAVEDLEINGQQITPKRGDVIESNGVVYSVMPRLEPKAYRYTDGTRSVYRIYTAEEGQSG